MVLADFIIETTVMEIIMEMCKITSNVIKFRIKMFQLALLPRSEPTLLKNIIVEINE